MNPCVNCNAQLSVHENCGCAYDRLYNAAVDLKQALVKALGVDCIPQYQCRYKEYGGFMNEYVNKHDLLSQIEADIAEGKLPVVTGNLLIRYVNNLETVVHNEV